MYASDSDRDLAGDMSYTVEKAYNEDLESVTQSTTVEDKDTPIYIVSLGVFFALIGMVILGGTVYFLLRRYYMQSHFYTTNYCHYKDST